MAKQNASKKKGPKGKKARAKAKLERQWGETAIVDDEKPRRVGKSRLMAKAAKSENKPTIRWAEHEERGNTSMPSGTPELSKILTSKTPRYHSDALHRKKDERKDYDMRSDSDEESDDDETPVLQGLLEAISKKSQRVISTKIRHGSDRQYLQKPGGEQVDEAMSDVDENSSDGSDSSDDESHLKDEQAADNESAAGEADEDSVVDEAECQIDIYRNRFSQAPLEPDEIQPSTNPCTSKVTVNGSLNFEVITPFSNRSLDSSKFGPSTTLQDLQYLAESSFEVTKKVLRNRWKRINKIAVKESQVPVYPFLTRYMDLLVPADSRSHRKDLHQIYLLHVLNHVLTSRSRVQRHNRELKELEANAQQERSDGGGGETNATDVDHDRFRDQGFTRPTVLVLLPTRGTCHKFIHDLIKLAGAENKGPHVERFDAEFGKPKDDDEEEEDGNDEAAVDPEQERRRKLVLEKKGKDWNALFGDDVNQDDDFKIGVALTPKAAAKKNTSSSNVQVKLYTDFFKSDIIVASPLGLKMLIAPDDEGKDGDSDYLSSIEICLVEYADVLMMQNWDHANDIFRLLNKEPQKNNDTDFSRVRNPILERQGEYWRQLIMSTDIMDPFLLSSFKRFGKSVSGSVKARRIIQPDEAALANVLVPMKQVFQRVPVPSFDKQADARVNYFLKNILPEIQRQKQKHTMIYIPSYFDFVAIRNVFLKREISFVSVHEYSRVTETSRARARFLQGRTPIMLFTGRSYFFHRHAIKGIRNLIFLGLPEHPQFYSEQVNWIKSGTSLNNADDLDAMMTSASSCLVLFTKFEGHALERVVGTANCGRMLQSDKATFMFHS